MNGICFECGLLLFIVLRFDVGLWVGLGFNELICRVCG